MVALSAMVVQKETLLSKSIPMFLKLRPIDPRSLMQGDYMILRMALESKVDRRHHPRKIIVRLDENDVAQFVRHHKGEALGEREYVMAFSLRGRRRVTIGSGAFFFQEGKGRVYGKARYARVKVAGDGQVAIIGLADASFNMLGIQ